MQWVSMIATEISYALNALLLFSLPVALAFGLTGGTYYLVSKLRDVFFENTLRNHWLGKVGLILVYTMWITCAFWAFDISTSIPNDPKGIGQFVRLFLYQLPVLGALLALTIVILWELRRSEGAFSCKT